MCLLFKRLQHILHIETKTLHSSHDIDCLSIYLRDGENGASDCNIETPGCNDVLTFVAFDPFVSDVGLSGTGPPFLRSAIPGSAIPGVTISRLKAVRYINRQNLPV
jgi:hypothetical protein